MAKVDGPNEIGWYEPPPSIDVVGGRPARPPRRQLSLIQIMVGIVYFAILFWAIKQVLETEGDAGAIIGAVVLIGAGLCVVGLWGALKLTWLSWAGWFLFVLGFAAILIATTAGIVVLPSLPILIGGIIFLNLRRHANNQDALLWVLEVAAERGIPLAPGVEAFSRQVHGMYRVWTASLARLLSQGVPLPEALDSLRKLVTRRSALMIRVGWESGDLTTGLREAGAARETRQPALHAVGGRLAYLGWVAVIGSSVVGFVLYFIIPKFEAIFHDFGIALPELTILVIRASHYLVDYTWLGVIGMLAGLGYAFAWLMGPSDLTIPIFDRLLARRHTIAIFRALAVSVSAGRPIERAFRTLAEWYPARWVRKRLGQTCLDASQGVHWTAALLENGLVSESDVGVLASAERAGNLAWALRELAETGERRWAYRLQVWSQVLFVATMLVLGLAVFLMAVAFFLPMITIIERLS